MTNAPTATAALLWTGATAKAIGAAIAVTTRRLLRTARAIITVTKRHVPAWLGALLTVCLFIPGPLDEMLVLLVIGVMVAFKPVMRSELVSATREAWTR